MAHNSPRIDIKYVVVCDDIRREDNGKEILIGVYSGDILVGKFPINLTLSFWTQFEKIGAGKIPIRFRVSGPGGVTLFQGEGEFDTPESVPLATLALGGIPVQIQRPGNISLELKQGDDEWQTIKTIGVSHRPAFAPPSGSVPPFSQSPSSAPA
jgi:hypothetical protein